MSGQKQLKHKRLKGKKWAGIAVLAAALLIAGVMHVSEQYLQVAAESDRREASSDFKSDPSSRAVSTTTNTTKHPAAHPHPNPNPSVVTHWTAALCAEYQQWAVQAYRSTPSDALLDALRQQVPAANIDRQTLALAFASINEIGVAAARLVAFGSSQPEAAWQDSAYGHYSAAQLRALATNGDSEAMRIHGLQQLSNAWTRGADGLRIASLARWQDGLAWLSQSVARGNREALNDLLGNSLIAASIGVRKELPEATQLKRDYLLWNHMATRIGTAAQVLNGAANLRDADFVAPALKVKFQATPEDEQWLRGRFAELAHMPALDTLNAQTRHALIALNQSEEWFDPPKGACANK